jgi:hypothetical protein
MSEFDAKHAPRLALPRHGETLRAMSNLMGIDDLHDLPSLHERRFSTTGGGFLSTTSCAPQRRTVIETDVGRVAPSSRLWPRVRRKSPRPAASEIAKAAKTRKLHRIPVSPRGRRGIYRRPAKTATSTCSSTLLDRYFLFSQSK